MNDPDVADRSEEVRADVRDRGDPVPRGAAAEASLRPGGVDAE